MEFSGKAGKVLSLPLWDYSVFLMLTSAEIQWNRSKNQIFFLFQTS